MCAAEKRSLTKACAVIASLLLLVVNAAAQNAANSVPGFWDPGLHLERPNISGLRAIRFLTDDDYPPLNFAASDGSLSGFNVDLARAVCEELQVACTIQARRWDTLVESLVGGKGDAIAASVAMTFVAREAIDFTQPFYRTPARFVAKRDAPPSAATPKALAAKRIGVVEGEAHKAYLEMFFGGLKIQSYPNRAALYDALRSGAVDAIFSDGLGEAIWLGGSSSGDCCAFFGGPFTESRFFGEGVGFAVRREDSDLRRALDWALSRVAARGTFAEIHLKYFPIGFE